MTADMLELARENADTAGAENITYIEGLIEDIPLPDESVDVVLSNCVINLSDDRPSALREALRVLRPGGKLLVFDANWYRYLFDEEVAAQRLSDQSGNRLEGWDDDAQSDAAQEREFEKTAAMLPLSPVLRPAWDIETLTRLGAAHACADEGVWREVWTENECSYYGATPMFLVDCTK
jgi:SAM-dependent methyltransferase